MNPNLVMAVLKLEGQGVETVPWPPRLNISWITSESQGQWIGVPQAHSQARTDVMNWSSSVLCRSLPSAGWGWRLHLNSALQFTQGAWSQGSRSGTGLQDKLWTPFPTCSQRVKFDSPLCHLRMEEWW